MVPQVSRNNKGKGKGKRMKTIRLWMTKTVAVVGSAVLLIGCQHRPAEVDLAARAMQLQAQGSYAEAVSVYEKAMLEQGQSYDTLLGRGTCQARLGRTAAALADLNAAAQLKPRNNGEVAAVRAPLLVETGQYELALADVDEVLLQAPDSIMFLGLKGKALLGMKRYRDSERVLHDALARAPAGSPEAMAMAVDLTQSLFELKEFSAAAQIYFKHYFNRLSEARRSDKDYYWAGALYHVNLDDAKAKEMWNRLSPAYRKAKGIK